MPYSTRLAGTLDRQAVLVHLQSRTPEILRRQDFSALYDAEVAGVATEIVAIAGDPPLDDLDSPLRLRALSLGVASSIESSLFPEQQLGDTGRSSELRQRFLAVLAILRDRYPNGPASGTGTGASGARYAAGVIPL